MGIGAFFAEIGEIFSTLIGISLVVLVALVIGRIIRGGSKRREAPDVRGEVDDLRDLADRMERRMENLETILTGQSHVGYEKRGSNAADRSDVL